MIDDILTWFSTKFFSFSLIQKIGFDLNGKYTASVFDGLEWTPYNPNLAFYSKVIRVPKISYPLETKGSTPLSKYTNEQFHLSLKMLLIFVSNKLAAFIVNIRIVVEIDFCEILLVPFLF